MMASAKPLTQISILGPRLLGPKEIHGQLVPPCKAYTLLSILTHLAYIANGKKRVILCNNFTGRISVTLLCGIYDVSYPTKQR